MIGDCGVVVLEPLGFSPASRGGAGSITGRSVIIPAANCRRKPPCECPCLECATIARSGSRKEHIPVTVRCDLGPPRVVLIGREPAVKVKPAAWRIALPEN